MPVRQTNVGGHRARRGPLRVACRSDTRLLLRHGSALTDGRTKLAWKGEMCILTGQQCGDRTCFSTSSVPTHVRRHDCGTVGSVRHGGPDHDTGRRLGAEGGTCRSLVLNCRSGRRGAHRRAAVGRGPGLHPRLSGYSRRQRPSDGGAAVRPGPIAPGCHGRPAHPANPRRRQGARPSAIGRSWESKVSNATAATAAPNCNVSAATGCPSRIQPRGWRSAGL